MLEIDRLSKRFSGLVAVDDVSMRVSEGSITGLIGPNGAGKTTLFAMTSGFLPVDAGDVRFEGETVTSMPPHERTRLGMVRTFQIVQPFAGLSVRENIAVGAYLRTPAREDALTEAETVGNRLGLGSMLDLAASSLTVAGRKRLELARALATRPRLLLLDEVLAGLNPTEIRDILPVIRSIRDDGVTIFMIEHIMQAVMNLCETVYVLNEGKLIAEGAPAIVCSEQSVVEAYLGQGAAARLQAEGGRPDA